ncbi:unnamed protein product [Eruca vesicaria subsp. sativa]|uniref:Cyclin-dependent protein kinase inhibitor SMR6 n=1 Tax=Eruca vesicaria subsp. sativa TaxID=29727 RepID=A0ABC8J2X7_ERUVS|nr:unnamed protein product [Eruca vesicaria subsp. sativa]
MGSSKKSQLGSGSDSEGKKWVLAEISVRASLKPVKTKSRKHERDTEAEEEQCLTPTANEAKRTEKLRCPPAPRKRRPALKCRSNVGVEYFVPPSDLETVFIRRVM